MFELPPAMISTTTRRVELKYPVSEERLDEVVEELASVLPIYRYYDESEWSSLRTTYLDTLDQRCYQDYLQDLPIRRKVRIRQYGVNGRFDDSCWVELKVKSRSVSLKRRFRCTLADATDLIRGKDVLNRVQPCNTDDVTQTYQIIRAFILEQGLLPIVRVDYQRLAFQHPDDGMLRLTLDAHLRYTSVMHHQAGALEGLVMEVKHGGAKPLWLRQLREKLDIQRIKKFSKFARSLKELNRLSEQEGLT